MRIYTTCALLFFFFVPLPLHLLIVFFNAWLFCNFIFFIILSISPFSPSSSFFFFGFIRRIA